MLKGAYSRIIQLSDLHVFADKNQELLGVKTHDSFQAVVDLARQEIGKAELMILSGDLTQDGSAASYKAVAEILKAINMPIYCFPGNHDDVEVMRNIYPLNNILLNKHIVLKSWHIILLNSQKRGAVEGHLDAAELNYLEHCLQMNPDRHALIMFHHQPMPVGSTWLDNLGLKNAEEFWQVVSHYPTVKSVMFGHVHQEFQQKLNGIQCYSAPSTCIQFMRHQDEFGLEYLAPGYRAANLFEDGGVETKVIRTHAYVGTFDENAKGY